MIRLKNCVVLSMLGLILGAIGCGENSGRSNRYNYSPSVIQSGETRQIWWCGQAVNPTNPAQDSDTIQYQSINLQTNKTVGPLTVLAETAGAWDSAYTCNPKTIKGTFTNPLGDGTTYQYALYYVGTQDVRGNGNGIGVAFSNDGVHWNKYPQPVIPATSFVDYGVGQPAIYNSDGRSGIRMFYEDNTPTQHHVAAISTDGVHFTVQGTLTTAGIDPDSLLGGWGDMAYDPTSGYWYAVFNRPLRQAGTTDGISEIGQLGIELYKIPDDSLFTGDTPWQELHTFDTNLTTAESNFLAGFVRDQFGNLNVGEYPTLRMYLSASNPPPPWNASPQEAAESQIPPNWIIESLTWVPNHPLMALNRYANSTSHVVTTGWVNPAEFKLQELLGHVYESPQQGATVPFYACKNGSTDFFVSLDHNCEGERMLGKNGYAYSHPVAGLNLIPLYRCSTKTDHFVSKDAKCEGSTTDELLGYVLP
jgi:hypothetical protein